VPKNFEKLFDSY